MSDTPNPRLNVSASVGSAGESDVTYSFSQPLALEALPLFAFQYRSSVALRMLQSVAPESAAAKVMAEWHSLLTGAVEGAGVPCAPFPDAGLTEGQAAKLLGVSKQFIRSLPIKRVSYTPPVRRDALSLADLHGRSKQNLDLLQSLAPENAATKVMEEWHSLLTEALAVAGVEVTP